MDLLYKYPYRVSTDMVDVVRSVDMSCISVTLSSKAQRESYINGYAALRN